MSFGVDPGSADETNWKAEFAKEKAHINQLMKDHNPFAALQYIMTSFFNLLTNYNEGYRMGSQAKIENVLSKLQQDRNAIESDFDANQAGKDPSAAKNAMKKYQDIEKLLKENDSKYVKGGVFKNSWVKQVEAEFVNKNSSEGTIFQGVPVDPTNSKDVQELAKAWHKDWQGPSGGNPPKPSGNPAIQGVTNALSAVSTDFSSQSSIAESKLKYYETWDEQYLTVQHSMMSNYINQEKSPNTSMQSAAS